MILLEADLRNDFGVGKKAHEKIRREDRYDWLNNVRNAKHAQHWQSVGENLKLATKRDTATHSYFDALLHGNQSEAERLLKDLYAMIKKPPIPEEITVDISFLLDVTGSMTPYCQHATSIIGNLLTGTGSIITMLRPLLPETAIKLRFSAMAYKDLDDGANQFTEFISNGSAHFTEVCSEIVTFIKSAASNPSGGKDICEDHLGAIDRCINWNLSSDWTAPIKFIVVFTDAPTHGLAPLCSTGQSNVDNYTAGHPKGLTSSSVTNDMITNGVNLVICSYNPSATAYMEQTIAEDYLNHPDNSRGKEIKSISMISQSTSVTATAGKPLLGDQRRHMVFVLDESGSMQHEWAGVVKAFNEYVARRRQNQNEEDLVSVVQFDCSAHVTVSLTPIGKVPASLGYRGGGTYFVPPANEGSKVILQTPSSHIPTLVFMSDGGTNDSASAATILSNLNGQVRQKYGNDLELHVIAFGNGADTQQLSHIANSSPMGRIHMSSDTIQLTNIFITMAGGQHLATALQSEIGKEISEAVSNTLSLEYLS
jgi:von Willebrand factor type A domain